MYSRAFFADRRFDGGMCCVDSAPGGMTPLIVSFSPRLELKLTDMKALLDRYGALLSEVDIWFRRCLDQHPDLIECCNGCSDCCRGLFDITLLDALYLRQGFAELPEPIQRELACKASQRLEKLSSVNPAFVEPWLLNGIPEGEWDALMPEEDETPCLLLSETGGCLIYDHRPMTCRLNGIPLIDVSGEELFDEWCTLNFTQEDPRHLADLRFTFTELFAQELLLFQELVRRLTGTARNEVDLFIPAAIVMDCKKIVPAIAALNSLINGNDKVAGESSSLKRFLGR